MRAFFVFVFLLPGLCLGSDLHSEVARVINSIRSENGLSVLENNRMLADAAQSQSDWMSSVGRMDHMREPAKSFDEFKVCNHHPVNRVINSGYYSFDDLFDTFKDSKGVSVRPKPETELVDEIVAWGRAGKDAYRTDIIVSGWMRSPGHRKAILNPAFRDMGVGITSPADGEVYWCVVFGMR